MSNDVDQQWIRGANVLVKNDSFARTLASADSDQPDLRIVFQTHQLDEQSPNHCQIRVYNLSDDTVKEIQKEYTSVVLQAGYKNGTIGTIFVGTIKQFRTGRERNVDSFIDLLIADGDVGYNFGVIAATLTSGQTLADAVSAAAKAMGLPVATLPTDLTGTSLIRGKVLLGMGRDVLRDAARSVDASWSIQNGAIQMIPLDGYLPGDAVAINSETGMVGVPELTDQGVKIKSLLNPRLRVGGLVKIDNRDIVQLALASSDPTRFDSFSNPLIQPSTSADGLYRLYSVEHSGDTRGHEWYSDMIALAIASNEAPST